MKNPHYTHRLVWGVIAWMAMSHFAKASRSSSTLSATLRPAVSITMCSRFQGWHSRTTTSCHVGVSIHRCRQFLFLLAVDVVQDQSR